VDSVRKPCYGDAVAESTPEPNQAPSQRRGAGRPRAVASDDLINVCYGILLARPEGLKTYELVDLLKTNPELTARTRQGRFKQVERALRSSGASARGIVTGAPNESHQGNGRPPSKIWRIATRSRRAA
jgi:hypothetical protein